MFSSWRHHSLNELDVLGLPLLHENEVVTFVFICGRELERIALAILLFYLGFGGFFGVCVFF